jgi:hypothetical protein
MSVNKIPKFADLTVVKIHSCGMLRCVWLFLSDKVSHLRRPESSDTVQSVLRVDQISPCCETCASRVLLHVPAPWCHR